ARAVLVLPLVAPPPEEDDQAASKGEAAEPVGALIVEQFRDVHPLADFDRHVELVRQISGQALANAVRYDGQMLAPVSRALERLSVWRRRPWTRFAVAAALAVVALLIFTPADFELEGRGTLEPKQRHDIFAPIEGVVKKVLIDHGDMIQTNDVLAELRNID